MTATNHTLSGIAIAATLPNPFVALPLAFLAHFVLDALPHFDFFQTRKSTKLFSRVLLVDSLLAAAALVSLYILQPEYWLLLVAGGIACASPDLMWLPHFLRTKRGYTTKPHNVLLRFHKKIQWGEREWGIWVELLWAVTVVYVLYRFVF